MKNRVKMINIIKSINNNKIIKILINNLMNFKIKEFNLKCKNCKFKKI